MTTNEQNRTEQPLVELATLLWRRRGLVLLTAAAVACAVLTAFNLLPRRYRATAVFERRGDAVAARTDARLPESFRTLKPVMKYDLAGAPAVEQALAELGALDELPRDERGALTSEGHIRRSELVERLRRGLEIEWLVKSENVDRVSVTLSSTDPILAYRLPNRLVDNYIRQTRQELQRQLADSCAFMEEQLEAARIKADQLRGERYAFVLEHPDMLSGDPRHLTDRLVRLDAELDALQRQRDNLSGRLAAMRGFGRSAEQEVPGPMLSEPNPAYAVAAERAAELKRQLDAALSTGQMTERHPRVASLREALTEARAELTVLPPRLVTQGPAILRPAEPAVVLEVQQIERDLDYLARRHADMTEQRRRLDSAQANSLPVLKEYQRLSVQIEDAEGEVKLWRRGLVEVQMALDAERNGSRTNLATVTPAGPVYRPNWPPLWMAFALALGGGLACGVLLAVLRTRFSRCFASAGQVHEVLRVPVLATVGPILTPAARRARTVRRYLLTPAATLLLLGVMALAGTGVVLSQRSPQRHAEMLAPLEPLAQILRDGARGLLGLQ